LRNLFIYALRKNRVNSGSAVCQTDNSELRVLMCVMISTDCSYAQIVVDMVGGVAQWLGRRSLAGGLSLIYAWSMVDMWPLRG